MKQKEEVLQKFKNKENQILDKCFSLISRIEKFNIVLNSLEKISCDEIYNQADCFDIELKENIIKLKKELTKKLKELPQEKLIYIIGTFLL